MRSLYRFFCLRHQRRHLLRAFLGLASIALGVALFVSVEIAQSSTVHGFERSVRRLSGRAELEVSRGRRAGIERAALERIEKIPGVAATPVLQRSTTFPDLESGPVMVLGVDFLREARFREFSFGGVEVNPFLMNDQALLVTRTFAARHGLKIGRRLRVNTPQGLRTVHVAGLIDDRGPAQVFDGNLAVMGVGGAQKLFATEGRVDRIDVFPAAAAASIREALGPGCVVEPVQGGNSIMEDVLARIRSLRVIGMIAALVGLFIVYLSVSMGVVERTKEVGTMRALGASRGQILGLFLAEAGLVGFLGSCLGLMLGYGLASVLTEYTATAINLLSFLIQVDELVVPAWTVATALLAGTLVSVFAALIPSLQATGISPIEVLRPARYGYRTGGNHRRGFLLGAALLSASATVVLGFYMRIPVWAGMFMSVALLLAVALMLPQVTVWMSRLLRRPLRSLFRIEGYLAADNIMKFPQRTSLTVIALGAALSIMVTTASVCASFERSGLRWLEGFPWDLSVQSTDLSKAYFSNARLPAELAERVKNVEGVHSSFAIQSVLQEYGKADVMLTGIDFKGFIEMSRLKGIESEDLPHDAKHVQELIRGEAVALSRNFARLHGLAPGDEIELRTPRGPRSFRVNSLLDDYTWPQGSVMMDLGLYREVWNDPTIAYIDLRVRPGSDPGKVKAALGRALAGEYQIFIYSREQLIEIARGALNESFRLVQVQMVMAMMIGFLGIVNTLLISVLRRTREIGLLRAVGMTRGQVVRTVVIESILVAFVGGVIGVLAGLVGAAFPVSMHIARVTGFELSFLFPWAMVLTAMAAALVLGVAASWLPARRAAGLNLLEAIGYE